MVTRVAAPARRAQAPGWLPCHPAGGLQILAQNGVATARQPVKPEDHIDIDRPEHSHAAGPSFLRGNNADDHAKQRLMPTVRDLIQTAVIAKTRGHQPASLQVHGSIANIMASMEALDLVERPFILQYQ